MDGNNLATSNSGQQVPTLPTIHYDNDNHITRSAKEFIPEQLQINSLALRFYSAGYKPVFLRQKGATQMLVDLYDGVDVVAFYTGNDGSSRDNPDHIMVIKLVDSCSPKNTKKCDAIDTLLENARDYYSKKYDYTTLTKVFEFDDRKLL